MTIAKRSNGQPLITDSRGLILLGDLSQSDPAYGAEVAAQINQGKGYAFSRLTGAVDAFTLYDAQNTVIGVLILRSSETVDGSLEVRF